MKQLRRASVTVAFSLLTSAATAYAECAWVLWPGGVKASGETVFVPIEGYPTRAECMKGRTASVVDEVEQLKRDSAGAGMKLAFTCLPDTVDPRGPKICACTSYSSPWPATRSSRPCSRGRGTWPWRI